jgi:regulatory protein
MILVNKILNYISYRHRSRQEIITRFKSKGFNARDVKSSISRLEEMGYIDDNLFAKIYIESLVKSKRLGKRALRYKLVPHKLDKNSIDKNIEKIYRKYKPEVLLEYHINKFLKAKDKTMKNKMKLINLLKRKGFHHDEFEVAVENIQWIN